MSHGSIRELRRAVEALPSGASITLPRDALLDILASAEVEQPAVAATAAPTDRLLNAEEVAMRMRVSKKYVYEHAREFPFARRLSPKALRFSEQGLLRWMARR